MASGSPTMGLPPSWFSPSKQGQHYQIIILMSSTDPGATCQNPDLVSARSRLDRPTRHGTHTRHLKIEGVQVQRSHQHPLGAGDCHRRLVNLSILGFM